VTEERCDEGSTGRPCIVRVFWGGSVAVWVLSSMAGRRACAKAGAGCRRRVCPAFRVSTGFSTTVGVRPNRPPNPKHSKRACTLATRGSPQRHDRRELA